jgi:hypothetical protein
MSMDQRALSKSLRALLGHVVEEKGSITLGKMSASESAA